MQTQLGFPMASANERLSELRRLLTRAAHAYYVLDAPEMEDPVYDRLYRELLELRMGCFELQQFPALPGTAGARSSPS